MCIRDSYMTLPVLVMTVGSLGGMTRYVRAAMIEALSLSLIHILKEPSMCRFLSVYRARRRPARANFRAALFNAGKLC